MLSGSPCVVPPAGCNHQTHGRSGKCWPFFDEEDFATALLAHVADERTLVFDDCGHDPPFMKTARGVAPVNCAAGLPLGLGPSYDACGITWNVGDRLLLYTDGLVEARNRPVSSSP